MSKINLVLDASMLDVFLTCKMKFNLRHNLLKTAEELATPLDRGGVLHVGEEAYYKSLQSEPGKWELAVDRGLVRVRYELSSNSQLDTNSGNRILDVLEESWKIHKYKDLSYEILAVESPFSYILHEDEQFRIIMIGKIDLLVNDAPNYFNLPIDHKSYERSFPLKRLTNQFLNYSYAVQSNFLFVNRVGMAESISLGHGKSTKDPAARHKRVPLSFDPLIWNWWKKNTVQTIMEYYDCAQSGIWPANLTSCDKYNRICEYYENYCDVSGQENRDYKLATYFKDAKPWDVSAALVSTPKGD